MQHKTTFQDAQGSKGKFEGRRKDTMPEVEETVVKLWKKIKDKKSGLELVYKQ